MAHLTKTSSQSLFNTIIRQTFIFKPVALFRMLRYILQIRLHMRQRIFKNCHYVNLHEHCVSNNIPILIYYQELWTAVRATILRQIMTFTYHTR